jgi:hypothetical protein
MKGNNFPFLTYIQTTTSTISMTSLLLEKDADSIYDELQDWDTEETEDEYREDRMEQMISKYNY